MAEVAQQLAIATLPSCHRLPPVCPALPCPGPACRYLGNGRYCLPNLLAQASLDGAFFTDEKGGPSPA